MQSELFNKKEILSYATVVSIVVMASILLILAGYDRSSLLLREDGMVETFSAVLYFVCFIYIFVRGGLQFVVRYYYFALLLLIFGFRELDFHTRFTTMGMFKTKLYVSPEVPLTEKAIVFIITLGCLFIAYKILKNHLRQFLSELSQKSSTAIGVATVGALIFASKAVDGSSRYLQVLGIDTERLELNATKVAEEVMELGIPILLILVFMHVFRRQREEAANHTREPLPDADKSAR